MVATSNFVSNIDFYDEVPGTERLGNGLRSFAEVVWYDQAGTGQSEAVADELMFDRGQWVETATAVLDDAGWSSAMFLGWDSAACVMLAVAAAEPARVEGLVFVNPVVCS